MPVADWYHCSLQTVSRSAGRSVVAAAAYRLGMELHDERYGVMHDYTRKRGIESTFAVVPDGCDWAVSPEELWNAAERAEKRINSTVGREINLALPAFLSPKERRRMAQEFAHELVERYGVAVYVAIHEPGREGDDRNYHAHILFTTREVTPDGLGKKTRILDDQKTGRQETLKIRELAADIINKHLAAANSDIRVDHRSFKDRGIDREATTHLGVTANAMERKGKPTDRGDINREIRQRNAEHEALQAELAATDKAIEERREVIAPPPKTREEARARMERQAQPRAETVERQRKPAEQEQPANPSPPRTPAEARERMEREARPREANAARHGLKGTIGGDGLRWWERAALQVKHRAHKLARALVERTKDYWQEMLRDSRRDHGHERGPDDGGLQR